VANNDVLPLGIVCRRT